MSQQTVQVVRESPIKRQEITVADSTAAMKLTIWEDLVSKLEVDKSYKIDLGCHPSLQVETGLGMDSVV